MSENKNNHLSPVERIKQKSDALRGTLKEGLLDELTGAIAEDDQTLVKFHGMYQQDDRDRREERAEKKLERLYSFMIRLRVPGGFFTPEQWIATHHIAGEHSTGTIKITTRQTIQLHGLLKSHIKPTLASFNAVHLDSIAACGDVNRNVTCAAHPPPIPDPRTGTTHTRPESANSCSRRQERITRSGSTRKSSPTPTKKKRKTPSIRIATCRVNSK